MTSKVPGRTAISFHTEAIANAIADAGISKDKIDALLLYRHFEPLAGDYDITAGAAAGASSARIPEQKNRKRSCTAITAACSRVIAR